MLRQSAAKSQTKCNAQDKSHRQAHSEQQRQAYSLRIAQWICVQVGLASERQITELLDSLRDVALEEISDGYQCQSCGNVFSGNDGVCPRCGLRVDDIDGAEELQLDLDDDAIDEDYAMDDIQHPQDESVCFDLRRYLRAILSRCVHFSARDDCDLVTDLVLLLDSDGVAPRDYPVRLKKQLLERLPGRNHDRLRKAWSGCKKEITRLLEYTDQTPLQLEDIKPVLEIHRQGRFGIPEECSFRAEVRSYLGPREILSNSGCWVPVGFIPGVTKLRSNFIREALWKASLNYQKVGDVLCRLRSDELDQVETVDIEKKMRLRPLTQRKVAEESQIDDSIISHMLRRNTQVRLPNGDVTYLAKFFSTPSVIGPTYEVVIDTIHELWEEECRAARRGERKPVKQTVCNEFFKRQQEWREGLGIELRSVSPQQVRKIIAEYEGVSQKSKEPDKCVVIVDATAVRRNDGKAVCQAKQDRIRMLGEWLVGRLAEAGVGQSELNANPGRLKEMGIRQTDYAEWFTQDKQKQKNVRSNLSRLIREFSGIQIDGYFITLSNAFASYDKGSVRATE